MKKSIVLPAMIWMVMYSTMTLAQTNGFLKAKGRLIVDGDDKTFILRGMGLGGWMLQESYMFHIGPLGPQHRIRQKIADLVGEEKTDKFYDEWLKYHTTRTDIDSMASWGFNSVRLPMHYELYTLPVEKEPVAGENTWLQKGFDLTDSLLAWCKANHMYLILDLHATPGGQGNDLNISDRDPSKPSLWGSEADRQKTIALWRKLAERYANEPAIGGYDIINEPNWGFEDPNDTRGTHERSNKPLRTLMVQITNAIREVDKKHIIIIEGNGFGNNYNGIFPLWDDNTVLSFHKYGNFNTQASIQNFLDWRDRYDVPLWLGESGENSNTWFTQAIRLVESNNIGWCWWQLKKMGINNPLEIKVTPGYQLLVDYWLNNGRRPSQEEAGHALNEWLENSRIDHNIYHKDVIDAMFRQVSSGNAIPFSKAPVRNGTVLQAVDFDLGRNGVAYNDNDTARYQYVQPPVRTTGNKGGMYRNDGVDIQRDSSGYSVFSIEDGEWLRYTVDVVEPGKYDISFDIPSTGTEGALSLICNEKPVATRVLVNSSSVQVRNVRLKAGSNQLKLVTVKGGFTFSRMRFVKR